MNPFVWLILTVLEIYFWIILATVVVSWLMAFNILSPANPQVRQLSFGLRRLTDPVLGPVRRSLPDLGGIDVSPMVVLLLLMFLQRLVAAYLPPILG
jgi:YggT family protein